MSATVEIDTGHHRELPGIVQTALAWAGYVAEPPKACREPLMSSQDDGGAPIDRA